MKILNGETSHQVREADDEVEMERLYERLSASSLKKLFFQSVKLQPMMISQWYKIADTEENMAVSLREKVQRVDDDIRRCVSLEVDSLALGVEDGWWKDEAKVKEMQESLESREHNQKLNELLKRFAALFASNFSICTSLLDKGHGKLAQFCAQLLIQLYQESFVSKDGLLSLEEEAQIVNSLLSFHSLFILGITTTYESLISPTFSG